jgi:broad specificity phosphatase PhoE
MPRIYLIRHGKPASTWGDHGGDPDPGLDALGRDQAEAAAAVLTALPAALRPKAVASSPLRRCLETAEPLALRLGAPLTREPLAAEIPTPSNLSPAERGLWLRTAFQGAWSEIPGDIDYEAWRRAVAGAVAAYEDAAIFTHFVAINAVVSIALETPMMIAFRPDHASITILDVEGGRLRLVEQGQSAATQVF